MQQILVVRHGIAVTRGSPDYSEEDRPLTRKGEERVRLVARALLALKSEPEKIFTSPLPRARRTADLIVETLGLADRLEEVSVLRPETTAKIIRDWLETRLEVNVMLVGHNPSLTNILVEFLEIKTSLPFDLKKAGAARLIAEESGYKLDWLITSGLIRRVQGC